MQAGVARAVSVSASVPRGPSAQPLQGRKDCGTLTNMGSRSMAGDHLETVTAAKGVPASVVDAVLAASRVLVGVAARSLAPVEDTVSLTQFRALVIIAGRGPLHLAALADAMGLHSSNATRACDRLVAAGLADRRDNPADRRHLHLTVTGAGRAMLEDVMHRRRAAITEILRRLPADDQSCLANVLGVFAVAGGEPDDTALWSAGWTTESTPKQTAAPVGGSEGAALNARSS